MHTRSLSHFVVKRSWASAMPTRSMLAPKLLLTSYPAEQVESWSVSDRVNSVANEGADSIEPVTLPEPHHEQPDLFDDWSAQQDQCETTGLEPISVSIRRRMRAVTGSSALVIRFPARSSVASTVRAAFSALICSASSTMLGSGSSLAPVCPEGQALSRSGTGVQFGQEGYRGGRVCRAAPGVAQLGFRDGEFSPERHRSRSRSRWLAVGTAFRRPWALVVPGEHGLCAWRRRRGTRRARSAGAGPGRSAGPR